MSSCITLHSVYSAQGECVWGSRASPLTLGVQQSGDAQLSLCHAEGLLQILLVALPVHLTNVNQSWPAGGNSQRERWVQMSENDSVISVS